MYSRKEWHHGLTAASSTPARVGVLQTSLVQRNRKRPGGAWGSVSVRRGRLVLRHGGAEARQLPDSPVEPKWEAAGCEISSHGP